MPPVSPGNGLPRARRLRRSEDFQRAQRRGQRVRTAHFILVLMAREPELAVRAPPRLGLVVSRKVGNAVLRNRVKRRVREVFRGWDALPAGVDLVVIAGPDAPLLSPDEIRREWSGVQDAIVKKAARALAERGEPTHVRPRRDR